MSDGPYKSLPMSKQWRKVAEYAYKAAFTLDDIAEKMSSTLVDELKAEIPVGVIPALQGIVGQDRNLVLFPEHRGEQFDAVAASLAAGHPLALALVDCSKDVAADGVRGPPALLDALARVAHERVLRAGRQIVEHFLRENKQRHPIAIRARIDGAIQRLSPLDLATRVLRGRAHITQKQNDLDDGPQL